MSMMHFFNLLLTATGETLYMVVLSCILAVIFGLPLGTWLFSCKRLRRRPWLYQLLDAAINISRSIPFIILLIALIPFTRLLVGTSIGINAAVVPLTLGAIPFFARLVDNVYHTLPRGLIETGESMGASHLQIIRSILLPEALPAMIQAITILAITLVNFSAMAGTVGGGGLGDLAIRYGYQRFNPAIMVSTIVILVCIVQILQWSGDYLSKRFQHH
ncbi:MAG: ABC transporter permease [Legionellaceae bacterium]|nr:ABC transporter permease [Legionellaceae bacterium]